MNPLATRPRVRDSLRVERDFFISYTRADNAWAQWIAWQLESEGFTTVLQAWDFTAGKDWAHAMDAATQDAKRTIAVLSPAYLSSAYGKAEWLQAFAADPSGEAARLVPVRVAEVTPVGLLATRIYIDLVGLDEDAARTALVTGAQNRRAVPSSPPTFPGAGTRQAPPAFPGASRPASEHERTLLATHERNVEMLEQRKAHYGIDAPLYLLNQLEEEQRRVDELRRRLASA